MQTHQATVFCWSHLLDNPAVAARLSGKPLSVAWAAELEIGDYVGPLAGYVVTLPDGVESRLRYLLMGHSDNGKLMLSAEYRISARWAL